MPDLDLNFILDITADIGDRLRSHDPAVAEAAAQEWDRAARSGNFAEGLMANRHSHRVIARACLRRGAALNDKERGFLEDIQHFPSASRKQEAWLAAIARKVKLEI